MSEALRTAQTLNNSQAETTVGPGDDGDAILHVCMQHCGVWGEWDAQGSVTVCKPGGYASLPSLASQCTHMHCGLDL